MKCQKSRQSSFLILLEEVEMGFLNGSDGKEPTCNAGDPGSIPGWGRFPGGANGNPTGVFLPGKSHGQRNLVGYSPWGCKESDTTESVTLSLQSRGVT